MAVSPGISAIEDQARALEENIAAIAEHLTDMKLNGAANELRSRLAGACNERARALRDLQRNVAAAELDVQWATLTELRRGSRAVAADALAFEQTLTLRNHGPASRVCDAADRLLGEFSSAANKAASHFALISEAEHFGPQSSAIHLNYADASLWALTKTAHEFGHWWANQDPGCASIQAHLVATNINSEHVSFSDTHKKEIFADIVGTYLLGPAFAYSGMMLDFNPAERQPSETHPTGDMRAHCVLFALKYWGSKLPSNEQPAAKGIHRDLSAFWQEARTAGCSAELENALVIEAAVVTTLNELRRDFGGAMYASVANAYSAKNALTSSNGFPHGVFTARDVLNGAWLARRESALEITQLTATAFKLIGA